MGKRRIFYKVYFSVIIVFLLVLSGALVWLYNWLGKYEAAQPINIINEVVNETIMREDLSYLEESCNLRISKNEKTEVKKEFFERELRDKKINFALSPKAKEGVTMAYVVKADEKRIFTVSLKKTESSSAFLPEYEIVDTELDKSFYKSITINAPSSAELTINGKKYEPSVFTPIPFPEGLKKYLNEESPLIRQNIVVSDLISEEAKVEAKVEGANVDVEGTEKNYHVLQNISDAEKTELRRVATEGSKAYAGYMQGDATIDDVALFFDTSCEFYKNVKLSYTDHIMEHIPEGFININNQRLRKYSQSVYSCKVQFVQVLDRNGTDYNINYNKFVFLRKVNGEFKIIDVKNAEN